MKSIDKSLQTAIRWMKVAKIVVLLTGAGVSAESGVPTFRGKDGLWKNFKAVELATPNAFQKDPKLVWEFYQWRRNLIKSVEPNPAHFAIARLESLFDQFMLITQNVDGLHLRAGSRKLIEIHGNIWSVKCVRCGYKNGSFLDTEIELPTCPKCGDLLRPDVVWFGESLDEHRLNESFKWSSLADVMVIIGTSGIVQPAASFAMMAKERGARLIEINLEPTVQSSIMDISILGKAGEVLPQLVDGISRG